MRTTMIRSATVLSVSMGMPYGFADEGGKQGTKSTRMKVTGVVSKVEENQIIVKTS